MSMEGWQNLACLDCGNKTFIPVVELIYKDGQGSVPKNKGYKCSKCGIPTDTGALIQIAKKKVLEQKIRDLQAGGA